jgi:hypothetical protein
MRNGVLAQIAELQELSHAELQERWRALHGAEPPTYNRALLIKRLAYRVQELAYGGLSEFARAELRRHMQAERLDAEEAEVARLKRRQRKNGMPVAGTRLIREWQGRRYEVTVVDGGFEYEGRRYRSLTAITKAITGTHWNGPAFFGLRTPERKQGA